MTGVGRIPALVENVYKNADVNHTEAVEFRLGEISYLLVAHAALDGVMPTCLINVSPAMPQVFCEAAGALQSGCSLGRGAVNRAARRL